MSIKKFITDVLNIESDKIESIDSIDAPNGDLSLRIKCRTIHTNYKT